LKTGSTQAKVLPSQAHQPTSAFTEKPATVFLTVIKRFHAFAATEQLTDGD
jgi:hypothetical protein